MGVPESGAYVPFLTRFAWAILSNQHEKWLYWKTAEPSYGHLKWDHITNYISGYDDTDHYLTDDAEIEVCMDKPYVQQDSITNSSQCVF